MLKNETLRKHSFKDKKYQNKQKEKTILGTDRIVCFYKTPTHSFRNSTKISLTIALSQSTVSIDMLYNY